MSSVLGRDGDSTKDSKALEGSKDPIAECQKGSEEPSISTCDCLKVIACNARGTSMLAIFDQIISDLVSRHEMHLLFTPHRSPI